MGFDFPKSPTFISKKKKTGNVCFLCHQECVLGEAKISELVLNNIKKNAEDWKGVGRFADIYDRTLWDSMTEFYVHNNCKIQIATKKKLDSARSRLTNSKDLDKEIPSTSCSIDDNDTKGKRWKRSLGPLHRPELCSWCLKPQDKSHKDRKTSPLHLIDHKKSWDQFRAHTVHLEDEELRSRILSFIDSWHDPYAAEIRYHPMCWKKYITYKERDIPLQKVRQSGVRILMLKHVKKVIFESNEPRSLKCLLDDYNILLTDYNMNKISRVTTVKEML